MSHLIARTAIVTGAGQKNGIGYAIARRLAADGADLVIHSFRPYDEEIGNADHSFDKKQIVSELSHPNQKVEHFDIDFSIPDAPQQLYDFALSKFGHIDILIINHTRDTLKTLPELNSEEIDLHLQVNVRASILLVQKFAEKHDGRPGGRIIMLTSGQHLGPMPHPAYVASKGALHQLTASFSDILIDKGITVNTVNPGATRTYTPPPEVDKMVKKMMPLGRWGEPDDAARLIAWLVSDEGRWVTGQVINSEGGFRRWAY
jgi:3-oxoacyl-[acyl-carrier protein] reductase